MSKLVYESKHVNDDKVLLNRSPAITKKFTSNFVKLQGLKPVSKVKV